MKTYMSTNVIVGQEFTESIGICNGLYQDNTMTPVLFSLYFGAIVDEWRSKFFFISLSHQGPARKPEAYGAGSHYLHLIK